MSAGAPATQQPHPDHIFCLEGDAAKKAKLVPASWGQQQIADASLLVVFAIKKNVGVTDVDRYIALDNFMTSAALLGIDTCPMEGIDPAQYDKTLGLTEQGYQTVVVAAACYRATADKYANLPKGAVRA